ncbi:MAG: hypothetical protein EPN91_06990 [Salinibacterium sp.]|nr:MAG: hypothetical protein EPN91_06990 [Salinibacterium sp.]
MAFTSNSYNAVVAGRHALVMEFTATAPLLTTAKFSFGIGEFGQPRIPNVGSIDDAEFLLLVPGGGGATTVNPVFTYRYVGPLDALEAYPGPPADYVRMGPFRYSCRPDNLSPIGLFCAPNLDADLIAGQTLKMVFTIFDRPGDSSDGSGGGASAVETDTAPVVIAAPTALTGAFVASDPIYVAGWHEVDWAMLISNDGAGPVTRADVQFEFAETVTPVAADWTALQTEAIVAGVSTPSTYEVRQPLGGAAPYTKAWTTQVRGLWMRILVQAGVGDPTGSVIALSALRRV